MCREDPFVSLRVLFLLPTNPPFPFHTQIRGERNKDKPLLRRKSDLPSDSGTVKALIEHKRTDEYLTTPPDGNNY